MRRCGTIFFTSILLVLSLTACTQVAWKSGSNGDDLKRDDTACREKFSTDDDIKSCLQEKGWTISDFRAPADTVDAAPIVAAGSQSAALPAPAKSDGGSVAMIPASASTASTAPATKKAADPNAKIVIQTWWKAGAQAADFNTDERACIETLGASSAPDYEKRLYSQPLIKCLQQHGWYAGRDPVYTPLR